MQKLTDTAIRSAALGTYWDPNLPGFGIRIGKRTKTFLVLVDSGRRHSIGHYPTISLADARREAKRIQAEKELGKVRPTHFAWDDAKAEYLAHCAKKNKPSTLGDYTQILARHFPFGRRGVADVTPRDILHRLRTLEDHPSGQRYAFATARAFLKWCVRNHIIERSPMENLQPPPAQRSRERVLFQEC